jgi:hypothetical protein
LYKWYRPEGFILILMIFLSAQNESMSSAEI